MDSINSLPKSISDDIDRIHDRARRTPNPQLVALSIALAHSDVIARLHARLREQKPLLTMRCEASSPRTCIMLAIFAFGESAGQPRLIPDAFAVEVDLASQSVLSVKDPYVTIHGGLTERLHEIHLPSYAERLGNTESKCCGRTPESQQNRLMTGTTYETIRLEVTSTGATVNRNSGDVEMYNTTQTEVILQNGSYNPFFAPPVGTVLISLMPGATAWVSKPTQGTPAWNSALVKYEIYNPCWPPGPVAICLDPIVVTPTDLGNDASPANSPWPERINIMIQPGGGLGLRRP
jgi:hypothetical protein